MKDVIVVGCGILGATISKVLRIQGRDVLTLDDRRPGSGTAPSGGHLKPSWFGGMKKTDYEPAMELLDSVWGLKSEDFAIEAPLVGRTGVSTTVYRVDTDEVMKAPFTKGTVTSIDMIHNFPVVQWTTDGGLSSQEERARLLVVTAGIWSDSLVNVGLQITGKKGVSFRLKGKLPNGPFIRPWAPYKQIVAHQQSENEIWIGDGSAILEANWTEERTKACEERCSKSVNSLPPLRRLFGVRPYVDSGKDPCFFRKLGPRAFVATGAGKSGTISAGWVSNQILKLSS